MPRKARPEGARHSRHNFVKPGVVLADEAKREAPSVYTKNPVPGDDGEALDRIAGSFRHRFPEEWANMAKCPLEAGLPAMAELLKGKG